MSTAAAPLLDIPNANALLAVAARFRAAAGPARRLQRTILTATDLPDALSYNPGDRVLSTILALAAQADWQLWEAEVRVQVLHPLEGPDGI